MDEARARARLASEMEKRRIQLRHHWVEVARRAGMSPQNLLRIRDNTISITWKAAERIEAAMEWEAGSVQAILDGGEPTIKLPVEPARPEVGSEAWWEDLARNLLSRGAEKEFWEVVEHAKMLKAEIPKRLAQRLAEYTERDRATHGST